MSLCSSRHARAFASLASAALLVACGGGEEELAQPAESRARVQSAPPAMPSQGVWSPKMPLTLVPAAAANLPDGRVLLWSAQGRFDFTTNAGSTYTAIFDPLAETAQERLVTETTHNMFCPGTTNLPDGRLLVNGGSSSGATSLFDPATGLWKPGAPMKITRAYQANTLLSDGSVFTLGGSWNGGQGNKHAELWTEAGGWRVLPGVPVEPMLAVDPQGVYRGDNHMWLIPDANGRVLHAGPSAQMNWIDTRGDGATLPAGPRGDDPYAMNGSIAVYDIGRVLKTGGAPAYQNLDATANAHVIDTRSGVATVRRLASMSYRRAFHNSVVLPNGQVMIIGGQTVPVPFQDARAVLVPELWDPATESFTSLPASTIPRTYHSSALLLPDARVVSIGGGLCGNGCSTNHPDLQIYTPHYLLRSDGTPAARPAIVSAPAHASYGAVTEVATDTPVASFVLIRLSSVTHGVNNDQRRVPLVSEALGDNRYALTVPSNPGVLLPGHYMLFALDAEGVPSVSKTLRIAAEDTPRLVAPGDLVATTGSVVTRHLVASGPGTIRFAATGLPNGLSLDAVTGQISGVPAEPGVSKVTVSASNAAGTVSSDLLWTVQPADTVLTRYVKLEALSVYSVNGFTTVAEFNLLDRAGAPLPRTGWRISADSQETVAENGSVSRAIDGITTTAWHTQYRPTIAPLRHHLVVDLGAGYTIGGFKLLPRLDTQNGRIKNWRLYVSADKVNWTSVAQGLFANDTTEKTAFPIDTGAANRWPSLTTPPNPTHSVGMPASLALAASDPDGDPLSFSVANLPPGLSVNATTGLISGSPSAEGVFDATIVVSDGRGGTASTPLSWTVLPRPIVIPSVPAAPVGSDGIATYAPVVDVGSGALYQWNFGDGSPVTEPSGSASTTHHFAGPGVYNVTLTVTDITGKTATSSFLQAVYATPASADRGTHSSNIVAFQPTSGSSRFWVVNQDADTVSLFNGTSLSKLAEVAVGSAPRTAALAPDGRLWVANKGSATISVVDPLSFAVVQTIALPRASQPFGVVFAPSGAAAYVSLEATGQLLKLDPASGALLGTLDVGANPRHVAVTPQSDRVLVSRFITPPLPGESTGFVQTQVGEAHKGGEVVVVDASFALASTIVLRHSDRPDSTVQGRGIPNYLGAPVISPDGRSAWVPSKQDNVLRGSLRDGNNLDFQNTVRAVSSRIDLATLQEDTAARIDHDNASLASAAAFHPSGAYLFVALPTSRQVAVLDPARGTELLRLDVGRAPEGLAVSPDGLRLYVNNFMDRTVQVIDLARLVNFGESLAPTIATMGTQSVEKLAANVLLGKRLFHDARDPRLARDGYMSCAVCHADGGHDGRTWDMTGFGEGLRNTISLRGRAGGQGFQHWSGNFDETQDFEGQIRTLAQGTGLMSNDLFNAGTRAQPLGLPKAGLSADLDALAAYVASLDRTAPSPYRQADGSLDAAATAGRGVFAANCLGCHAGPAFTASSTPSLKDIGTLKPSSGQRLGGPLGGIDPPTLRDVWATAPYLHDGSAATLSDAIGAHTAIALAPADVANVVAYLQQIGGEEPGFMSGRYVRLEALSVYSFNGFTTVAELNLLDPAGVPLSRTGWTVTADSEELVAENGSVRRAIDGINSTAWHTKYRPTIAPLPHQMTIDLGSPKAIGGMKLLPRLDTQNGRIKTWRLMVSPDLVNWTTIGTGTFANSTAEKTAFPFSTGVSPTP